MSLENDNHQSDDASVEPGMDTIIQRVLADPRFVHQRDAFGNTPLLQAIDDDNAKLVQFLLAHGADPNVEVDDGYTCLLTAVERTSAASMRILKLLITAGANVHVTGMHDWAPLHMAACRGRVEKAQLLIQRGADVNQRIKIDGLDTPLIVAATHGQPQIVQLLLNSGGNANLKNAFQSTPLDIARQVLAKSSVQAGRYAEVVQILEKHVNGR